MLGGTSNKSIIYHRPPPMELEFVNGVKRDISPELLEAILTFIPPADYSPYMFRCVCRKFRDVYAKPSMWSKLLQDHFPDVAVDVAIKNRMRPLRDLCKATLRAPWSALITAENLTAFRVSEFGELKKLKYLDLYPCYKLVSLPERFGELKNLQTLDLRGCWALGSLPEGFGKLENLQTALFFYFKKF